VITLNSSAEVHMHVDDIIIATHLPAQDYVKCAI